MKSRIFLIITLSFLSAVVSDVTAQELSESMLLKNWAIISQKLQSDTLLAAEFEMESSDRFGSNESVSGTLYLWGNGYKIETNSSKMLVYEGTSTVLDATQLQQIISTYVAEDDDFAPAKLLQKEWLQVYTQTVNEANQTIKWSTEDPFENFAAISLRLEGAFPTELIAQDQLENTVALFLKNHKWVAAKEAEKLGLFTLETPQGYEIIDLRDGQ